jgi:hypothetical protein
MRSYCHFVTPLLRGSSDLRRGWVPNPRWAVMPPPHPLLPPASSSNPPYTRRPFSRNRINRIQRVHFKSLFRILPGPPQPVLPPRLLIKESPLFGVSLQDLPPPLQEDRIPHLVEFIQSGRALAALRGVAVPKGVAGRAAQHPVGVVFPPRVRDVPCQAGTGAMQSQFSYFSTRFSPQVGTAGLSRQLNETQAVAVPAAIIFLLLPLVLDQLLGAAGHVRLLRAQTTRSFRTTQNWCKAASPLWYEGWRGSVESLTGYGRMASHRSATSTAQPM